ncbi:DUF2946 family protein [Xanthobacter sp. AM11]|uniref:DUF2946 family protein n=1 Tax=Xanthobacter sp. AM11 TaxID=3380643 RepID=UPI0039BF8E0A
MRTVAAWAVAYVLVLQAFLTSFAIAAMPMDGGRALCLSTASAAAPADAPGADEPAGTPAQVHCQACLARADVSDLTPPVPVPAIDRIAIELRFDRIVRVALRRLDPPRSFQPRAPPAFLPA